MIYSDTSLKMVFGHNCLVMAPFSILEGLHGARFRVRTLCVWSWGQYRYVGRQNKVVGPMINIDVPHRENPESTITRRVRQKFSRVDAGVESRTSLISSEGSVIRQPQLVCLRRNKGLALVDV